VRARVSLYACYNRTQHKMRHFSIFSAAALGLFLASLGGVVRSQEAPTQTQRIPQLENSDVRVWKAVIMPNAPLTMHRHEHPRVIIALNGGTLKIVQQSGASERHVWDTGHAYWLPASPPHTMHADVNVGDKPIDVMVVELLHEK
jgi:hypothetical protein